MRNEAFLQGSMHSHFSLNSLQDLFGTQDIHLSDSELRVAGKCFPIVDGVIILLEPEYYTERVRKALSLESSTAALKAETDLGVQASFGKEWETYSNLMNEHAEEFHQYFDLVNLNELKTERVCDLGCGMGRWSYFLAPLCRELVLVDFSDAIFYARKNLEAFEHCLFFMGDIRNLPFRKKFSDICICLGVLHHLPDSTIEMVRRLSRYADNHLVYLYYAIESRPFYFRYLFGLVDLLRRAACRLRSQRLRLVLNLLLVTLLYYPMIVLGKVAELFKLGKYVPLFESYAGKSFKRISQDCYDRFFTGIEKRFTKEEIRQLGDTYSQIIISEGMPYWHFLCRVNH